ncbi:hypothetical protein CGMCC3_g6270 [Colletotrichum fructicola]|nr:uncharacterized protein CGMCC3_g6270 [Colletotrichum fructicola]KAE9577855.1 hypothetical protein CGMCC3_g6270 [Colletotrichum fructicola]
MNIALDALDTTMRSVERQPHAATAAATTSASDLSEPGGLDGLDRSTSLEGRVVDIPRLASSF